MRDKFKGVESLTHRTRHGDVYCSAAATQAIIQAGANRLYVNIEEARVIRRWLNEAIDPSNECPVCRRPLEDDQILGSCTNTQDGHHRRCTTDKSAEKQP